MTFVPPVKMSVAERLAIDAALEKATTDPLLPQELRDAAQWALLLNDGPRWNDPTGPRPTRRLRQAIA